MKRLLLHSIPAERRGTERHGAERRGAEQHGFRKRGEQTSRQITESKRVKAAEEGYDGSLA